MSYIQIPPIYFRSYVYNTGCAICGESSSYFKKDRRVCVYLQLFEVNLKMEYIWLPVAGH